MTGQVFFFFILKHFVTIKLFNHGISATDTAVLRFKYLKYICNILQRTILLNEESALCQPGLSAHPHYPNLTTVSFGC